MLDQRYDKLKNILANLQCEFANLQTYKTNKDEQGEQGEQDEPQCKKKIFCIQCANHREIRLQNTFYEMGRQATCIVMRTKQIADSPIKPAHVIREPSYDNAREKNKNNDCQDFIEFRNE